MGLQQKGGVTGLRLYNDFSGAGLRVDSEEPRVASEGPSRRLLLQSTQEVIAARTGLEAAEWSGTGYIPKAEPARFLHGLNVG